MRLCALRPKLRGPTPSFVIMSGVDIFRAHFQQVIILMSLFSIILHKTVSRIEIFPEFAEIK